MRKKLIKKCCKCGKPGFSINSIYCRTCSHFSARMSNERFPPEIRQSLWNDVIRRRGYFCHYTQVELDVFDYTNPYFLEFDHVVPHDPREVVIACSWVNTMKADMTKSEFRRSIKQLYNHMFKGIKIKKKKFRYWFRLNP